MIKCLKLIAVILAMFSFSSCVPTKKMIYMQDASYDELQKYQREEYFLQTNDIIDIQIKTINEEANRLFMNESQAQQALQVGLQNGGDLYYMTGYSIDKNGEINLPFVGKVSVAGKSLSEAEVLIDSEVAKLFNEYHLTVKLGGIRFATLGEFNQPGKKVLLQNQATIFEAISSAGDLTMVADRRNIKLVRQYPEGSRIYNIDLLSKEIISSPYYFIHPNDLIYAEPLPQKSIGLGITGSQTLTTIVGTLSTTLALVLSIVTLTQ